MICEVPFLVDLFANHYICKVKIVNYLFLAPGTELVVAFSEVWSGENNWLVSPVTFEPNALMLSKAQGIFIVTYWPSASFLPILFGNNSIPKIYILDILSSTIGQDISLQF
jgi:hypothetical protein